MTDYQSPESSLHDGCEPTVKRVKRSKSSLGRLPDKPAPDGCAPPSGTDGQCTFAELIPYIPNLTDIAGTDGALNKAALTVSSLGVIFILRPWFNQAEGDYVWVNLNGAEVTHYTVSKEDADIGKHVLLTIESVRFIDQANNKLQAFVRATGGNTDETRELSIWVDAKEPAGLDPQVSTPTINENMGVIRFKDASIEAFGIISQAAAQLGVEILIDKYPLNPLVDQVYHRKEGDVIYVSIGGTIVTHTVSSFEASGTAPISITIYYGTWQQVTPGVNILEWYVRDKAGNQSIGFSVPRLIQNNAGGGSIPYLNKGHVIESGYDDELKDEFINVDAQTQDLNFEVSIRNHGWLANDKLLVTYTALTSTGDTLTHTESYTVLQPTLLRVNIALPLEFVRKLTGGRLLVTYVRIREGERNTPSLEAEYRMLGTPVDNRRLPPVVHGTSGNVLPVDTNPVKITVRDFGQAPGTKIDLIIEGKSLVGDPVYLPYTEIAGDGDTDFVLDYWPFSEFEGSSFMAFYIVDNDKARPSQSVIVQVGDIQILLPAPRSQEALPPDHVFDELVSKGNLRALVDPHSAIALNDEVRVVATGSKPGGSTTTAWLKVTSIWFNTVLPFTIARAIVLNNKNGTMTLHWEVRTQPTDIPLKSLPLVVNVGAMLQLNKYPTLLESTPLSPAVVQLDTNDVLPPRPRILTFRAEYDMQPQDLVTLVIRGKPGLGTPNIPSKPGIPDAGHTYITFTWSSSLAAAYLGGSFTAYFEVLRNGQTLESPALTVNVLALSDQALDVVSVPEEKDGVIDASQPANVRIDEWPFFNQRQAVFIRLRSSSDLFLRQGIKVSAAEFAAKRTLDLIPEAYRQSLPKGSVLTVEASVSMDELGVESSAIKLKPVEYVVDRLPVISKHIPVGQGPHQIVITQNSVTAFVFSFGSKSVSIIDIARGVVVTTLNIPNSTGIALNNDGTKLVVSRFQSTYVSLYDTATFAHIYSAFEYYSLLKHITATNGAATFAYGAGPYNYVNNLYLYKINTNVTGSVSKYIATIYDTGRLYMSPENILYIDARASGIRRLDTVSDTYITEAPFRNPIHDIAFSKNSEKSFFAANTNVGMFNRLLNDMMDVKSGFTMAVGVAPHPSQELLYVADNGDNTVKVLDTSTNELKDVATLQGFNGPRDLKVTPNGRHLLVSNDNAGVVTLVSL
ncbi:YncE family protein [Pseudomonas reactans]|uniref:YncE family protein n=1 Tax=Pseudomonas reactans TaxID=117680 RepID=UPI0015A4BFB2|nr:YncE family protein [Pseudomonas reactans]NWA65058.1 YncE family protein [Pseudomonas reactans]